MSILELGFLLCSLECKEEFLNKNREKFKNVDFIASKDNWNLRFTVNRKKEITEEEIKRFENKLNRFYREIKPLIVKYELNKNPEVAPILERIKNLKEEYLNYPFRNRELFFNLRLEFYLQQIRKAALRKTF